MNPFISIWRAPKQTVQYMVEHKSLSYGLMMIFLATLSTSVMAFADTGFFDHFSLPAILFISIISSLLISIAVWFMNAAIYTGIGKLLGGTGKFRDMCLAVSAASIPMIWMMPVGVVAVLIYGKRLFAEPTGYFGITNMSIGLYLLYNFLLFGLGIFGTVILAKGIGYVHNFSAWRGFGVVMIYLAIVFIIVIVIVVLIVFGLFFLFS